LRTLNNLFQFYKTVFSLRIFVLYLAIKFKNILKQISSIQNPFIKNLVLLQEKANRKQSGTFLIEGQRNHVGAKGGYEIETILLL
jgi:hypothetical protein